MTHHDEFAELVLQKARQAPPFKPMASYNADDDSLEILISDENYVTRRSEDDRFVTVYLGRDTGDVIGLLINHVRRFIKDGNIDHEPTVRVEIRKGKLKVVHLIRALRDQSIRQKTMFGVLIKQIEEVAEEEDLEATMCAGAY